LLTHSCTAALEMAAILADLAPGDEVIMPSFTFVSTANAVALRGAVPVFVDIRPDTLNIDECAAQAAVTPRTKAIFVVHYAGICAEMDAFRDIAAAHRLLLVEDAAQALLSTYRGRPAGTLGDAACISFHATKNVVSGEGGALVTGRADLAERAEIIREKGTDRSRFLLGQVDRYSWVDVGSSYLPSELVAAFLRAQLEDATAITAERRAIWDIYHAAFADIEALGLGKMNLPRSRALKNRLIWVTVRKACGGSSSPNARARSIKAILARRTRARSNSVCAISRARSRVIAPSVLPAILRASLSSCLANAAVEVMSKVRPWR
jgi:dTDP-4-amino-4,6-dideoxygalactose transaminase